jgi:hypothetical protein
MIIFLQHLSPPFLLCHTFSKNPLVLCQFHLGHLPDQPIIATAAIVRDICGVTKAVGCLYRINRSWIESASIPSTSSYQVDSQMCTKTGDRVRPSIDRIDRIDRIDSLRNYLADMSFGALFCASTIGLGAFIWQICVEMSAIDKLWDPSLE